jgi:ABC-type branched-subunit amino acid transport system substrate-binding protein
VRRALAGVGSLTPAHEGVTGSVAFDGNGDVPIENVYIGMVRRGAVEVVDGADAPASTR